MKIRIQDDSIRFRLTLREVEEFAREGRLERHTRVLSPCGPAAEFTYALERAAFDSPSEVFVGERAITMRLGPADFATLIQPDAEGAYIRREWTAQDGSTQRFLAFVEKDRPGSTCVKPEAWIYDAPPHGALQTRPIPHSHQLPSQSTRRG